MAKSKNGGSRAYIRGRIGSDVYSVGKNGMGEKQQVVRSLAEQVANPRSQSQMFGRMVMSTVMQAVSALTQIIDHSFDGYPKGQPSISQFIKRNYALVKDDAQTHHLEDNVFGLNKYQEKGVKAGHYIISDGNEEFPTGVTSQSTGLLVALTAQTLTVGGLKAKWGISGDDFITKVFIDSETSKAYFFRVQLTTSLADSTAITDLNVASLFTIEGNCNVSASLSTNTIQIACTDLVQADVEGAIVSKKIEGAWKHSKCVLDGSGDYQYTADMALPTYPVGEQMFLNGGDL